jgi:type VI protein secretion system component Hcp
MTYLNLFIIYLPLKYFKIIIQKFDLNLNRNLTNQMVHFLPLKMTNHSISYFANKKDHLNHNGESKSTLFYICHFV